MKINDRIAEYKKQGYAGLYYPGECACEFDCPCEMDNEDDEYSQCKPGYIIRKEQYNEEEKELWSDYDFIVGERKP